MWLDLAQLALGAALVASPWYAGFVSEQIPTYSAWGAGAAAALIALLALTAQWRWLPWLMLLTGLWAMAAPWALDFGAVMSATWSHVTIGAALLMAGIADLVWTREPPKTKQTA